MRSAKEIFDEWADRNVSPQNTMKLIVEVQRDALEEAAKRCDPEIVKMTAVLNPAGGPTMMLKEFKDKKPEEIKADILALMPPEEPT